MITPWMALVLLDTVTVATFARCFSGPGELAIVVPICLGAHLLAHLGRRVRRRRAARRRYRPVDPSPWFSSHTCRSLVDGASFRLGFLPAHRHPTPTRQPAARGLAHLLRTGSPPCCRPQGSCSWPAGRRACWRWLRRHSTPTRRCQRSSHSYLPSTSWSSPARSARPPVGHRSSPPSPPSRCGTSPARTGTRRANRS